MVSSDEINSKLKEKRNLKSLKQSKDSENFNSKENVICPTCNVQSPTTSTFCRECGTKFVEEEEITPNKVNQAIKYITLGVFIYALIILFFTFLTIFDTDSSLVYGLIGAFPGVILGSLFVGFAVKSFLKGIIHGLIVGFIGSIFAIIMLIISTDMTTVISFVMPSLINQCIIIFVGSIFLGPIFGGIGGAIGSAIK